MRRGDARPARYGASRHPKPHYGQTTAVDQGLLLLMFVHIAVTLGPINAIAAIAPTTMRPQTKPHSRVSVPCSSRAKRSKAFERRFMRHPLVAFRSAALLNR